MIEAGLHVDMESRLHGAAMAVRSFHKANMHKGRLSRESTWQHGIVGSTLNSIVAVLVNFHLHEQRCYPTPAAKCTVTIEHERR